ncbi:hypothetical protein JDFnp4_96 [Fusobacterium phage JD-Fnp4]|nr:hypothetical protein JDFnp4_96 [Fusobacterium phage JD-Fnp4]
MRRLKSIFSDSEIQVVAAGLGFMIVVLIVINL